MTLSNHATDGAITGRERVTAALAFTTPDRVPRDLWALPYMSGWSCWTG